MLTRNGAIRRPTSPASRKSLSPKLRKKTLMSKILTMKRRTLMPTFRPTMMISRSWTHYMTTCWTISRRHGQKWSGSRKVRRSPTFRAVLKPKTSQPKQSRRKNTLALELGQLAPGHARQLAKLLRKLTGFLSPAALLQQANAVYHSPTFRRQDTI